MDNKNIAGILAVAAIIVIAVIVTGPNQTSEPTKIQISGSTTVLPIMEECALKYMSIHPDTTIFVAAGGSSAGIKAVRDGVSDIGMASRKLKTEELPGVVVTAIAQDKIAIIVHPDNPMSDITQDTLKRIYSGEITNFVDIGGADISIMVVTREAGSGTRSTVEKVLDKEILNTAIVSSSNGVIRTTVAGNEAAIGYISLGYVDDTVKVLNVDENIGRELYLINNEDPAPEITEFIDFVLSAEGQAIVEEVGFSKV